MSTTACPNWEGPAGYFKGRPSASVQLAFAKIITQGKKNIIGLHQVKEN